MDPVIVKVQKRLKALGFEAEISDVDTIQYYSELIYDEITLNINWSYIPDILQNVYIDMICGEYLYSLYQLGKLNAYLPDKPEAGRLTSITAGNVSYGFEGELTERQKLLNLIDSLRNPRSKRYLFDIVRRAL